MPDYNQPGKAVGDMPTAPTKPAPVRQQGPGASFSPAPMKPNFMNEQRLPQQPAPIKQAPLPTPQAPPFNPGPPQPSAGAVDEFGRPLANMAGFGLSAVPDFNQRKANAQAFSAPPQMPGAPAGMPGTGGGFMGGPPPQMDPAAGGGFGQGGQPGAFQPPPQFQQMLQQPGFMQWLMRMFQSQQGGGQGQLGPGQPPQPQFQPANQGPPR